MYLIRLGIDSTIDYRSDRSDKHEILWEIHCSQRYTDRILMWVVFVCTISWNRLEPGSVEVIKTYGRLALEIMNLWDGFSNQRLGGETPTKTCDSSIVQACLEQHSLWIDMIKPHDFVALNMDVYAKGDGNDWMLVTGWFWEHTKPPGLGCLCV